MKSAYTIRGKKVLLMNMRRLREILLDESNLTAWNGAQHLFARTRAVVPYLTGKLYRSAYISKMTTDRNVPTWIVGYDTTRVEYAVPVHEIPALHPVHPNAPSREAKRDHFLSGPRDEMLKSYPRQVRRDIQRAFDRARFVRHIPGGR